MNARTTACTRPLGHTLGCACNESCENLFGEIGGGERAAHAGDIYRPSHDRIYSGPAGYPLHGAATRRCTGLQHDVARRCNTTLHGVAWRWTVRQLALRQLSAELRLAGPVAVRVGEAAVRPLLPAHPRGCLCRAHRLSSAIIAYKANATATCSFGHSYYLGQAVHEELALQAPSAESMVDPTHARMHTHTHNRTRTHVHAQATDTARANAHTHLPRARSAVDE